MTDNTLPKSQRLASKAAIDALFEGGKGGFVYPFKYVVGAPREGEEPTPRMMVSVGKRNHKRANKRNTIKRRTREAYRLNKTPLMLSAQAASKGVDIAFIYISKEVEEYKTIESAVRKIISLVEKGS